MIKPRVFIGASRENQNVAEAIQQSLDHLSEVEVWDQGTFGASQYPLESLELKLETADFAVFVFSPDDVTMMRGEEKNTVRDNVVFELGLFIGRLTRRRTFIVSPRDSILHLPSDLAGLTPLDYEANRADNNLRAALGSACTSVRAAIREHGPMPRPSRELAAQEPEPPKESEAGLSSDFYTPAETWDMPTFAHVYLVAVFLDHGMEATAVDAAFRASHLAREPEDLAVWEAACDWVHVSRGENRGIKRFRDKVGLYPKNPKLRDYLGRVLNHYGDKEEAKSEFERAAESSADFTLTSALILRAVNASEGAENASDYDRYRALLIGTAGIEAIRAPEVLSTMRTLAEKQELDAVSRGIDELRIKASPDDTSLRFDVAHRHGEDKQSALSMYHYQAIPAQERNGTVWNNLGVAFAALGMPGRAVEAYSVASEKGETIADGNLAHKLVSAGFLAEAKIRAEAAVKTEGHHENVVGALAAIQSTKDEEAVKEADAISSAKQEQEFLVELGRAGLAKSPTDILGLWETPEGPIEIHAREDGALIGKGHIETDAPIGLGLMFSPVRGKQMVDISYTFKRFGNALQGSVARDTRGQRPSLLGFGLSDRKILAIVADDGQMLQVREMAYEISASTWTRMRSLERSRSTGVANADRK